MKQAFVYNADIEDELNERMKRDYYRRLGQELADRTKANATFKSYKKSVRWSIRNSPKDGVLVYTKDSFAHLDEWGGAKSSPSAAMRRACESVGLNIRGQI